MAEYRKQIGIVGAGAAGCVCAYFLIKSGCEVYLFDNGIPLRTILPTGGGRCNLAHAEYDFKELAKNYPRGQKFLYSVFSKFSTYETVELFNKLGIKTYTQEDGRIFPTSNSAKEVRSKILNSIKSANFIQENVTSILSSENGYRIKTNKAEYYFQIVVIATGGGCKKKNEITGLKHKIVPYKPSLVGLNANIRNLSGITLKKVYSKDCKITDDILFTHYGISGPLTYKISSYKAYENYPYKLCFDLFPEKFNLQDMLNSSPHKNLKNILSDLFPHRFAEFISENYAETKGYNINGDIRNKIIDKIHNFEIYISGTNSGEETVTAGGFDLNEINSSTMESKIYPNLYFIGEALDIDGLCGGFNLQNAWSTAFAASENILKK